MGDLSVKKALKDPLCSFLDEYYTLHSNEEVYSNMARAEKQIIYCSLSELLSTFFQTDAL